MGVVPKMLGKVFPWLNHTVEGSSDVCVLPHANKSPKNNGCGPKNTHMYLPDVPDQQTRELILRHNQLDLKVYNHAKRLFQLEKYALGFS